MPRHELIWARFEGALVLFHRPSGLTHLVNDATAALLGEVLTNPKTLDDAASQLAAAQGAHADQQYVGEVAELVRRLEALGLVERIDF